MQLQVISPEPALRPWVQALWLLDGECRPGEPEPVVPDLGAELIFHFGVPVARLDANDRPQVEPQALLMGQATRPYRIVAAGRVQLLGLRFQPHALAPLARVAARSLVDACVPVDEVLGLASRGWHARLQAQPDGASRLRLLQALLGQRLPRQLPRLPQALLSLLEAESLTGALAKRLGLGPRRLQQMFQAEVGVPPALLRQLLRAQQALRQLRKAQSLADVAASNGYVDQAHMSHGLKRFSGLSPARLRAEPLPMQSTFLALAPFYKT